MRGATAKSNRLSSEFINLNSIQARALSPLSTAPEVSSQHNMSTRKQELRWLALLSIFRLWMANHEKKKRQRKMELNSDNAGFQWISLVEAGFNIGIIYKSLTSKIQNRVARSRTANSRLCVPRKQSERLQMSREAISSSFISPSKNREFNMVRKETMKVLKMYSMNQEVSIKSIFSCVVEKGYCLLQQNWYLPLLARNKVTLGHLKMVGEGFRSLISFFNRHLNMMMLTNKLEEPEWEVFELIGQYETEFRTNTIIPDKQVPRFFRESVKISVALSEKFFHSPSNHKSVDGVSFKEFLEITISLRYDLCYLQKCVQESAEGPKKKEQDIVLQVLNNKYSFRNHQQRSKSALETRTLTLMKDHGLPAKHTPKKTLVTKENNARRLVFSRGEKASQKKIKKGRYVSSQS